MAHSVASSAHDAEATDSDGVDTDVGLTATGTPDDTGSDHGSVASSAASAAGGAALGGGAAAAATNGHGVASARGAAAGYAIGSRWSERPRWWRKHVRWTERTARPRRSWAAHWPRLAHRGAPLLVLAALTAVLAWLVAIRFDATLPPPCMQGLTPSILYTVCNLPDWNPHSLGTSGGAAPTPEERTPTKDLAHAFVDDARRARSSGGAVHGPAAVAAPPAAPGDEPAGPGGRGDLRPAAAGRAPKGVVRDGRPRRVPVAGAAGAVAARVRRRCRGRAQPASVRRRNAHAAGGGWGGTAAHPACNVAYLPAVAARRPRHAPVTSSDCDEPPNAALFTPQAIAVLPSAAAASTPNATERVYVLAITGRRVAVEWFDLALGADSQPTLQWVGCTLLPPGTATTAG